MSDAPSGGRLIYGLQPGDFGYLNRPAAPTWNQETEARYMEQVRDRAQQMAKEILAQALAEAEQIRSKARSEGFADGLEEGKALARLEVTIVAFAVWALAALLFLGAQRDLAELRLADGELVTLNEKGFEPMEILVYTGPQGHTATLTTESPVSHYGIPVLRIEGPGMDDLPDYGPADILPSGLSAQELVWSWASDVWLRGDAGEWAPITEAGRDAARAFCSQGPFALGEEVSR